MKTMILIASVFFMQACKNQSAAPGNTSTDSGMQTPAKDSTKSPSAIASSADTNTIDGSWFLVPVLPSDTMTGRVAHIIFNLAEKGFAGSTGCNRMSGKFEITDTSLKFNKDIITTKMACPGYNEAGFLQSLLKVNNYGFEKGELLLKYGETILSRWNRKPVKVAKTGRV